MPSGARLFVGRLYAPDPAVFMRIRALVFSNMVEESEESSGVGDCFVRSSRSGKGNRAAGLGAGGSFFGFGVVLSTSLPFSVLLCAL